jgi:diacylglycerol kinase (ATP)
VVAGGDGTVQEAVDGLMPADGAVAEAAVAVVPLGTGNDLARTLGVPLDPHDALRVLARGRIRTVDLVRARCGDRERHLVNFAIGGFAGDVADRVTPDLRRRWGGLVYLRAALAGLPSLRRHRARLIVDGEASAPADVLAVVVANGRLLGGGIPVAPRAEVDDGRLDLVALRGDVPARVPLTVARLLVGRHLDAAGVIWRRGRSIEIRSADSMPFNGDGQPLGRGDAFFRVLPGALRVVVPTG